MSMTTDAYERIRDAIVSGGLEFGEQLSEVQIAQALGMSKAPVRAAFIELRDKGLVEIVPQSGTYVFSPTIDDVRTMSEFRAMLEERALNDAHQLRKAIAQKRVDDAVATMRRAVSLQDWDSYRRADSAFHMAFIEESGNRYLMKAYQLTSAGLEALRVRLQGGAGNFRERSFREHCDIAEFFREGRTEEAIALLKYHILIINEWVDTLPLEGNKSSRKDKADDRDYVAVFARPRGNLRSA